MPLSSGTKLGPYEIVAPLGAGGMGEVYRAADGRLGREVAIKILPATFSKDEERIKRFEQEARAAGMLNHPNILAIHDIGNHEGMYYVVSELLEGETLRERMSGKALPLRKAVDYALQITRGLSAAHEKRIVHRDLKPENLFITKDGRLKILDFGLAKLIHTEPQNAESTDLPTISRLTQPGLIVGTAGYMSPEQVRGQTVDHRTDIFAFGVILYEMLSGRRAFRGESPVETMNAILKEEPPELTQFDATIPPALEQIVRHCIEKDADERFQSMKDIAFYLEALSGTSVSKAAMPGIAAPQGRRKFAYLILALMALICFAVGRKMGFRAAEKVAISKVRSAPTIRQLTFRRGTIWDARFSPDGQTILYDAAWDGRPIEIFSTRPESPESRSLGLPGASLYGVSKSGDLAIVHGFIRGMLSRVPLAGGAPRDIMEDVQWADWSPDGKNLAVVRFSGDQRVLEFPIGKILFKTSGSITHPRVSPKGNMVAFLHHPNRSTFAGSVNVVDLSGKHTTLSSDWSNVWGLAWSPSSDEIWFTATQQGTNGALYAVNLSGKQQLIWRTSGAQTICDIFSDGRVLLTNGYIRRGIICLTAGDTKERDLSWLDFSDPADLSDDGRTLLFGEAGVGGGPQHSVYIRKTDGSPAVRLGDGIAMDLSPDGKWALTILQSSPPQLVLLPTGPGQPKNMPRGKIEQYQWAEFSRDGKQIIFFGNEPGQQPGPYLQNLEAGNPQLVSTETVKSLGLSVDPLHHQLNSSMDGHTVFVREGGVPAHILRIDSRTGRKELFKEIMLSDPAGLVNIESIVITPDGKSYAYSYTRYLNDLYLFEGLK